MTVHSTTLRAERRGDAILADPRGIATCPAIAPAPRPRSLTGVELLLLDNGKLDPAYGAYGAIVDVLHQGIPEVRWGLSRHDLLKLTNTEIEPLADTLLAERIPGAVVFALADAGVSAQTALLALALEARGIPTALIATPMGASLCRAIYAARQVAAEPIVLDVTSTSTANAVTALMGQNLPALRGALAGSVAARKTLAADAWQDARVDGSFAAADRAIRDFQDWAEARGLGDGLALLPPTQAAVDMYLKACGENADEVIYQNALTSGRTLRIRDVAANAAMTGCPVKAFPVVVAALRAMAKPDYRLSQAAITTHPSGNAIVFSGGDPVEFGLSSGPGCLGPGHRGNASVGRTVSLAVQHVFGARPGAGDLTIFGSPAEFTYCLAESVDQSPWPSLASEIGGGSPGVFVVKAESPRNVLEHLSLTPRGLCRALAGAASSLCSNNSYIPSDLLVLINPEHARLFSDNGWSRSDLALALYNMARISRSRLADHGVGPIRPKYMDVLEDLPVMRSPSDVRIVVAGAPGPQSMVALPWGYSRGQWHPISRHLEHEHHGS